MHSKDASGPKEHAQPGIGPLARRVYELCPPQGIRVSRELHSKDASGPRNTLNPELNL